MKKRSKAKVNPRRTAPSQQFINLKDSNSLKWGARAGRERHTGHLHAFSAEVEEKISGFSGGEYHNICSLVITATPLIKKIFSLSFSELLVHNYMISLEPWLPQDVFILHICSPHT